MVAFFHIDTQPLAGRGAGLKWRLHPGQGLDIAVRCLRSAAFLDAVLTLPPEASPRQRQRRLARALAALRERGVHRIACPPGLEQAVLDAGMVTVGDGRLWPAAAGQTVLALLAAVLGSALLALFDWRVMFLAVAGLGVLVLLALLRWMPPELPRERTGPVAVERGGAARTAGAAGLLPPHAAPGLRRPHLRPGPHDRRAGPGAVHAAPRPGVHHRRHPAARGTVGGGGGGDHAARRFDHRAPDRLPTPGAAERQRVRIRTLPDGGSVIA